LRSHEDDGGAALEQGFGAIRAGSDQGFAPDFTRF
jgi:hypothetical protein